jgi:murein DD-endopeptidase MepM/ murein hydrolase activator NlpD
LFALSSLDSSTAANASKIESCEDKEIVLVKEVSSAPEITQSILPGVDAKPPLLEARLAALEVKTQITELASPRISEGEIGRGQTLARSLARQGVDASVVNQIAREMRGHFDFRRSRPGHRYHLIENAEGEIESFRYQISSIVSYVLTRAADGQFSVEREEAELWPREATIAGVITSSLYGAITDLGAQGQLANDFSDVFAYDVDFSRMVRVGDEFRIVYERLFRTGDDGEETFVRTGRILAARYDGATGEHTALYYEPEEGRGAYYRPDGSSVERQFLMAPVQFTRVSSRYSNARRHPILNTTRPHHGIDYAAPMGTPVYAVSEGKVIYKSRAGGFGNLVKVHHPNGYVSYYAHLARFARGMQIGQSVSQKQVIGFVGSTGLSTGPHVCFRVAKNGQYINPAQIASPAGPPIPAEDAAHFQARRDLLLAELNMGSFAASNEAL